MACESILLETADHVVATITINRPEAMNRFTEHGTTGRPDGRPGHAVLGPLT